MPQVRQINVVINLLSLGCKVIPSDIGENCPLRQKFLSSVTRTWP